MLIQKCLRGFTVVELLIVIVVISILATLTTVAYNGVVERSQDAVIASTVESYAKAITTYRAKNGRWPLASEATTAACIGNDTSYSSTYGYLYPGICSTLPNASTNTTFNELMKSYIPNPPDLSFMKPMQFTPAQKYARGIYYSVYCLSSGCVTASTSSSDLMVKIAYRLKAGKTCVIGNTLLDTPTTGFTTCEYIIQAGKP